MAISFLDDINLNDLEALNLVVQNLGSDPTGVEGKIIYNTGSNTIKYYNGTVWVELDGLSGITGTIGTVPRFGPGTTAIRDSQLETSGESGSQTFLFNTLADVTFKGSISLDGGSGGIKDKDGQLGSSGQLLSSTGTQVDWINAPVSYTKWVLTGDSGTQDIEDGNTVLIAGGTGLVTQASATDTLTITPAFDEYSSAVVDSNAGLLFGIDGDMSNSEMRYQEVNGFSLSLFGQPTGNIGFNSKKITSLLDPTAAQDAATKAYVDSSVEGGLTVKGGFLASTGSISGGGNLTVGGSRVAIAVGDYYVVTGAGNFFGNAATPLTVGDSVLVQTEAAAGASTEADFVVIQSDTDVATATTIGIGNVNVNTTTNNEGLSLSYSNGTGTVGFNIKNNLSAASALADDDQVAIFQGSAGSQGNKSLNAQLIPPYVSSKNSFAGSSNSGTTHIFTHNLGSNDVIVQLYDISEGVNTGDTVYADVTRTNTNTVTVTTAALASIRCLIQKVG